MKGLLARLTPLAGFALLCGCGTNHSALSTGAENAYAISQLFWHFLFILGLIYIAVVTAIFWVRGRRYPEPEVALSTSAIQQSESKALRIIAGLTSASAVVLVLLLADDLRGSWVRQPVNDPNALNIELTGHQWWWEARYQDQVASNVFETANEIHVPTGRTVVFSLQSPDVIHSLWVPSIDGKKDLVPGHPASVTWKIEKPGTYRGQCAEFCGYQHAHMALDIVAQPPAEFAKWEEHERDSAKAPGSDRARKGKAIFLNSTCVMCHTIEGTVAHASNGPGLTHLASRHTLAAGTLENNRTNLGNWILHPQSIKPGTLMPGTELAPDDLEALLDYLQGLE